MAKTVKELQAELRALRASVRAEQEAEMLEAKKRGLAHKLARERLGRKFQKPVRAYRYARKGVSAVDRFLKMLDSNTSMSRASKARARRTYLKNHRRRK